MITPGDMTSADDSSSWSNSLFTIQYIGNVGSVGIGLSNPAYKLHVAGDTMITSMTWGSGSTVTLNLGDTNQAIQAVYGTGMVFKTYGPGGRILSFGSGPGGQQLMLLSAVQRESGHCYKYPRLNVTGSQQCCNRYNFKHCCPYVGAVC